MSMANSLEQRVPFLDLELMRFVERIPAKLRARRSRGKWLHRQAVEPLVPREALERPKHGFSTPYDDWLRASLGAEVERRYAPGGELAELIEPGEVARLVGEHRSGRADHKGRPLLPARAVRVAPGVRRVRRATSARAGQWLVSSRAAASRPTPDPGGRSASASPAAACWRATSG